MRRLIILLAAVGALLLIPATQAFAFGNVKVNISGTGSGEFNSSEVEGFFISYIGEPPIECSYASPGPATGPCESEMTEGAEDEGIYMNVYPAAGSVYSAVSYTSTGGGTEFVACNTKFKIFGKHICWIHPPQGTEADFTVNAVFCLEGQVVNSEGKCVPPQTLTLNIEGSGEGTVVSNPAGLECSGPASTSCPAEMAEGDKVTLTASPSTGSLFLSWKGCEVGGVNGRQCTVTMDKAKTVVAKFIKSYDVTVNRVGSGLGKVSSSPGGVLCLSNCSSTTTAFKEATSVTLTAAPSKNYVFTEWTGACSGGSLTCSLGSLSAAQAVGAKFTEVAKHNLTVTKSGGGQGTAKSNLAGINCGATCSSMAAAYYQGQEVELTATPGKGSAFGGWSGACEGTGTCKVAMSEAKEVTAEFK